MKAVVVENKQLVDREVSDPTPLAHDVLVKIEAVAINPIDQKTMQSDQLTSAILGYDAVGIVEKVGDKASKFKVGDQIFYAGDNHRAGSFAQKQVVDERIAALAPKNLTPSEIAAISLTGLTAYEILVDKLRFVPQKSANRGKILVINGAGGVGSILTQLAHWMGLTVYATSSPQNFSWLTRNQTDYPIDYHQNIGEQVREKDRGNIDAVINLFDTTRYFPDAIKLARPFGQIVAVANADSDFDLNLLKPKSLSFGWEFMFTKGLWNFETKSQGDELAFLADLLASGEIKSTLGRTIVAPLSAAVLNEAFALLQQNHAVGKIVIEFEK